MNLSAVNTEGADLLGILDSLGDSSSVNALKSTMAQYQSDVSQYDASGGKDVAVPYDLSFLYTLPGAGGAPIDPSLQIQLAKDAVSYNTALNTYTSDPTAAELATANTDANTYNTDSSAFQSAEQAHNVEAAKQGGWVDFIADLAPLLALSVVTAGAGGALAGALAPEDIAALATGTADTAATLGATAADVGAGAAVGAGTGAAGSAITGGDPATGALTGALGGGLSGAANAAAPSISDAVGSTDAGQGITKAATGAATAAATGGNPLLAAAGGAAGSVGNAITGGVSDLTSNLTDDTTVAPTSDSGTAPDTTNSGSNVSPVGQEGTALPSNLFNATPTAAEQANISAPATSTIAPYQSEDVQQQIQDEPSVILNNVSGPTIGPTEYLQPDGTYSAPQTSPGAQNYDPTLGLTDLVSPSTASPSEGNPSAASSGNSLLGDVLEALLSLLGASTPKSSSSSTSASPTSGSLNVPAIGTSSAVGSDFAAPDTGNSLIDLASILDNLNINGSTKGGISGSYGAGQGLNSGLATKADSGLPSGYSTASTAQDFGV